MKFKKEMVILSFLLLIIPFINGFGITSMYWDTNPLSLELGQSIDVVLLLQNMVGESDVTLRAELEEGKEIAELTDPNLDYLIPFGRKDISVNVRISIPEDSPIDKEYNVVVSFKQIIPNEARTLQLTSAIKKTIPIKIVGEGRGVEKTEIPSVSAVAETAVTGEGKVPSESSYILVGVLLVISVVIFLILKRRNSKKVKIYKRKK